MDDLDELQNGIFAFNAGSEFYDATIVWFGDMKYSEAKVRSRGGYYIDALLTQEGEGILHWERCYSDILPEIEPIDTRYYPHPKQSLIKRIFEFTWS
jgi:hypothetical protein